MTRTMANDQKKDRWIKWGIWWASRGYALGDPTADWYEAERQLRAGL